MSVGVITDNLQGTALAESAPNWLLWYSHGLEIYAQAGNFPDPETDPKVGVIETPELAEEIIFAHNTALKSVQRH